MASIDETVTALNVELEAKGWSLRKKEPRQLKGMAALLARFSKAKTDRPYNGDGVVVEVYNCVPLGGVPDSMQLKTPPFIELDSAAEGRLYWLSTVKIFKNGDLELLTGVEYAYFRLLGVAEVVPAIRTLRKPEFMAVPHYKRTL